MQQYLKHYKSSDLSFELESDSYSYLKDNPVIIDDDQNTIKEDFDFLLLNKENDSIIKTEVIDDSFFDPVKDNKTIQIYTSAQIPTKPFIVLDYQNWEGEVLSIDKTTFKARLSDPRKKYATRLVDIKNTAISKYSIKTEVNIGARFEWTYKRIKTSKGQIKNKTEVDFYIQPQRTSQEINLLIEKEVQNLMSLFEE